MKNLANARQDAKVYWLDKQIGAGLEPAPIITLIFTSYLTSIFVYTGVMLPSISATRKPTM